MFAGNIRLSLRVPWCPSWLKPSQQGTPRSVGSGTKVWVADGSANSRPYPPFPTTLRLVPLASL